VCGIERTALRQFTHRNTNIAESRGATPWINPEVEADMRSSQTNLPNARSKEMMMFTNVKSLTELFEIELQYAYDCERKLAEKGLPAMIEAARSSELRTALQQHLQETRAQISRLDSVFSSAGIQPKTRDNDIIDKMMSAAKDSASNIEDAALRDTALIANGNQVEHYEIALYGSLAEFARRLGLEGAVGPLTQTLEEEKNADAKLTQLATTTLNAKAARAHSSD
jgi:ferritin-like metal-binding protein YciE